jgi:hypothetical protein
MKNKNKPEETKERLAESTERDELFEVPRGPAESPSKTNEAIGIEYTHGKEENDSDNVRRLSNDENNKV